MNAAPDAKLLAHYFLVRIPLLPPTEWFAIKAAFSEPVSVGFTSPAPGDDWRRESSCANKHSLRCSRLLFWRVLEVGFVT